MSLSVLVAFALAVVICAIAATALLGHLLRPKPKDRLLLWLGVFAGIYGLRMFCKPPLGDLVGIAREPSRYLESALSAFIVVPALLFSEELYGPGWKRSLRWVIAAGSAYAAGVIAFNVAARNPSAAPDPVLIVLAPGVAIVFVAGALSGYRPPPFPEWRVLVSSAVVFTLFVFNEHAVNARVVPWRLQAEPIGFVLMLAAFGWIALTRFFTQGRDLAAVRQEMQSARAIQQSILPRELPAAPGVRAAARYVPLADVAGDFYDVVRLDDGRLAVLVADVSGHGVPAALIASMVKVAFIAELARTSEPGRVLAGMNVTLCGMFERSYVTAACAVIGGTGQVEYALAGHPSPFVVSMRDGSVVALEERGMFLGMFPLADYRTATAPVNGRSRLILYTDGVTEAPAAHDSDQLFGPERLAAFAAAERAHSPEDFADALLESLRRFADRDPLPHDDVTVVVIDIEPGAGHTDR